MYRHLLTNSRKYLFAKGAVLTLLLLVFFLSFVIYQHDSDGSQLIIQDRNGIELYRIFEEGTKTNKSTIPYPIIASTLTAEDRRYFSHSGIDSIAWLRLVKERLTPQNDSSGGSTISQQVSRSILGLNRPRTVFNKLEDILLSQFLENAFTKSTILDYYLSNTDYGNTTVGIEAASSYYFGNDSTTISWPQATLLASLVKNPAQLNPYRNLSNLITRQQYVAVNLERMGIISAEEKALIETTNLSLEPEGKAIKAPHFVYFVIQQLEKEWGTDFWKGHTVKISTTLDLSLYENARNITNEELEKLADKNAHNSASIIMDTYNDEVLSYVGNNDFFDTDHAGAVDMIQAQRQPGSALKPFIYLATILNGWGTGTMIYDIPSRFLTASDTPYTPLNYDLRFHGPVTMRSALANSYNVPAVKALEFVGISKAKSILEQFGITSLKQDNDYYGLSLALGSGEVSLWELSNAYRTLARNGQFTLPQVVKYIEIDGVRHVPSHLTASAVTPSLSAASTMITDILSDTKARAPEFEEHNDLTFSFPVAAKTGTSRDFNDNWTVGFSPNYTVGVWVGNADGTPMQQVSGIAGAGPIFHRLMNGLSHNGQFQVSNSVEQVNICLPSGLLVTALCPHTTTELFLPHTKPTQPDNWYQLDGLHLPTELSSWQEQFSANTQLSSGLVILTPQNQDVFKLDPEIPVTNQSIPCRINAPQLKNLEISLNQKIISSSTLCKLPLTPGNYTLEVSGRDTTGKVHQQTVHYRVEQ